jgi:hypothetical protein
MLGLAAHVLSEVYQYGVDRPAFARHRSRQDVTRATMPEDHVEALGYLVLRPSESGQGVVDLPQPSLEVIAR